MKMLQGHGVFVLCATGLVLCTLYGVTLAQVQSVTLSAPYALSNSIYGEAIYLYNAGSQSIISPEESGNGLTMVPWQSFNSSMQWTLTLDGAGPSVYISSVESGEGGCASGTSAVWNAPKGLPVTTACSTGVSQYTNFIFIPTLGTNTYVIVPAANFGSCVTLVNNVPTIPGATLPPCNRLSANSQWQIVNVIPH